MRFRAAILATTITLVVAVVGASVFTVTATIGRAARATLAADLERSEAVFAELTGYRASLHRAQAQVVAQEPRLRAVVNTADIDHATVLDSARELQASASSDLFVLTDGGGRLRVDTAAPEAEGFDLTGLPEIAEALADGGADGVWIAEGRAFQVHAERLTLGTDVIGVLVLGFRIDDQVAETIERQTGAQVLLTLEGAPLAASSMRPLAGGAAALAGALAAAGGGEEVVEVDGASFMIRRGALPGSRAEQRLGYAIAFSIDEALAASRALVRTLLVIAGVAVALALLLALLLARRLARPVDRLVAFTRTIAAGELRPESAIERGPDELRALGAAMNRMVGELAESRAALRDKHRLEDELEIAGRIQTSILPQDLAVPGLEIGAMMVPATEVGGDYYDVIPQADGAWIGVGDVAGHGLRAGLVMLMVQSSVASLVRERPVASPRDLVATLNATIADNVRRRLRQDEHVTFSLLRYRSAGTLTYAGAHEPFLLLRAGDGGCEEQETPGTWLGVLDDISFALVDTEIALRPGDLVVLYTDGLIEARSAAGEAFGLDRVRALASSLRAEPCAAIARALVDAAVAWRAAIDDDISAVVLRYRGEAAA